MNLNRFLIKSTEESLRQLREAEKTEPASVPIRYLMALANYRMKGFCQAIEHFTSTLELDPNFALATYYLGLVQVAIGDVDNAMAHFGARLSSTAPTSPLPTTWAPFISTRTG